MKTQSSDTSIEAEKVLISLLQKASFSQKFSQVCSMSQLVSQLSKRAIARANNNLNEEQVNLLFVEYHYGKELAERIRKYLGERKK